MSEDDGLRGIIDWDGVAAMLQTLRNKSYLGWLTRNWDPKMYGYQEFMIVDVQSQKISENYLFLNLRGVR